MLYSWFGGAPAYIAGTLVAKFAVGANGYIRYFRANSTQIQEWYGIKR
jgi:hypothetical protein